MCCSCYLNNKKQNPRRIVKEKKMICPILAIESPEVIEPVLKIFISPKMGSAWIHATFQFPFFGQTQINFFPLLA